MNLKFQGVDRSGVARSGVLTGSVAAFVKLKVDAHWRTLSVTRAGAEVGGLKPGAWWAEDRKPATWGESEGRYHHP